MNTLKTNAAVCSLAAIGLSLFVPVAFAKNVSDVQQSEYLYFTTSPRRINSQNVKFFNSRTRANGVLDNQTNTMDSIADCKTMRNRLVSANGMYKISDANKLFDCYEGVASKAGVNARTPILNRSILRNTTGSTFRTQRGRTNNSERVTIKERYSEGTGVPNANNNNQMVQDPNVLADDDNSQFTEGTGAPSN